MQRDRDNEEVAGAIIEALQAELCRELSCENEQRRPEVRLKAKAAKDDAP